MISINELKQGNIISDGIFNYIFDGYHNGLIYARNDNDILFALNAKNVNPILLTEEILLNNCKGFIKDKSNGNIWIDFQTHYLILIPYEDKFYPVYYEIPELSSQDEQGVGLNYIEFLHEIQNLIYILRKEELEINLYV